MNIKLTLSRQDVVHIATLANLGLTEADIEKFQKQLSEIVDFVGKIQLAPVGEIASKREKQNLENVTREDISSPSLSQEEVLKNASQKENDFFKVKAIFDET